jgi:hypothetical protein
MIKAIHTTIVGLAVVSVMCGTTLLAEELGQPVRFSVGVTGKMTDNRDSVENNEQDNFDVYVRPRLDIVYEGENSRLDLFYVPAYRYRSEPGDTEDESTWHHEVGINAKRDVSQRARVRLSDSLLVTDDPRIEEGGVTLRGDLSYVANVIEGGLNYDLMEYSNVDIALRNRMKRYDDDAVAGTSDEDETSLKAQHRYQISRTLRSVLTASYAMYGYESARDLQRDFNSMIGAVGLENAFTPNLLGGVSVGWQTRDHDDDALDSDGAPYVLASIEGLTGADLRLGASAGMGVRDADAYPFVAQEYTEVRGYAIANLTPQAVVRASATYRLSEYDEDDVPSGVNVLDFAGAMSGDETTIVGDVELAFSVTKRASVHVGHRFEDIDSDVGQSYTKNTSRVGGSISF